MLEAILSKRAFIPKYGYLIFNNTVFGQNRQEKATVDCSPFELPSERRCGLWHMTRRA